jgi:serine/threonine protein kinase
MSGPLCGTIPGWTLLGTHLRPGVHGRLELAFKNTDASRLPCVVKRFTAGHASASAASVPAEQERRALLRLHHDRVVKLLDSGCDSEGIPYLVLPYYPLGHLTTMSLAGFSIEMIARMTAELLSAVDYAHGQGVLHGDLAACNVLLTDSHNVIIIDFGGSKIREELAPRPGPGASVSFTDASLALQAAKQRSEWDYWVWSDRHRLRSLCKWLVNQGKTDDERAWERSLRRELSECLAPLACSCGQDYNTDLMAKLERWGHWPPHDRQCFLLD